MSDNYNHIFDKKIKSEFSKTSQEYRVLYTIQHFFPGEYESMIKAESPDLLDQKHSIGIEVTLADSQKMLKMGRDYDKYKEATDTKSKNRYRDRVLDAGGTITDYGLSEPSQTVSGDSNRIKAVIQKKLHKLPAYFDKAKSIGLAIVVDHPYTDEYRHNWSKWIEEAQSDHNPYFSFFFLLTWDHISYYNYETKEQNDCFIDQRMKMLLKMSARQRAESEA